MAISQQSLHPLSFFIAFFVLAPANSIYAQNITPANDGLNTNVNQIGNQYNITGGTQAGANLFYSLQKMGLSTGEIANFLSNPSVQNILTRVTGGEASLINGLIQVTGGNSNLYIMNPAGIVFGTNARLNVPANFSATTATGIQVGNGWFGINSSVDEIRNLTGHINGYGFTTPLSSLNTNTGVIVNEGTLNTNVGKSVTLVGGRVVNTGTIATSSGNITIAVTPDNKFIQISNEGNVLSFELPISDRQALGNAPVLRGVDLPRLLIGKTAGTAIASGNLDVSGDKGGNVQILGNDVSLANANINASGVNGGGTVLIGGDFQGTGTTPKSLFTTVDANSKIIADALASGNGGRVVVWSDGTTAFDGSISAKAGTLSGNGGLVETSGKTNLIVGNNAKVDTLSFQGATGTWLLDPTDLTVVGTGGTGTITAGNNSVADSTINNSTIVTALNSTNVNLTATNSINVNAAIDSSANTIQRNLRLTAPTTNLNAPITLRAGSVLSGTATTVNVGTSGSIQNGVDVSANGGTVNLAATTYTLSSTVNIGKDLTINGAGAANTTVNGNNAVRIFFLDNLATTTVNINDLTFANGASAIADQL
jgi:filamentous hemagglutinin family protein